MEITGASFLGDGTCSGPLCGGDLSSLGSTLQLQATGKNGAGFSVPGQTFTWSSQNEDVVTVSISGLETAVATAVANGTATITATTGGIQGSVQLTVEQVPATIEITPVGPLTLTLAGATESLTAVAKDAGGSVVAGALFFTWVSDNGAVAVVDADGTVTALTNGVANITAFFLPGGESSNTVEVTVAIVTAAKIVITP